MLSEKILTRQRQLVTTMIERLTPYVIDKGHPADRVIARFFKDHRELGSRDRRFLSACFFSYFRWLGWTKPLALNTLKTITLSVYLDQTEIHPALSAAKNDWEPLGGKTLDEKLAAVREWFPDFQGLEKSDLLFPEFGKAKQDPDQLEEPRPFGPVPGFGKSVELPEGKEEIFYETLQTRPPTWLRLRKDDFKKALTDAEIPFEEHPLIPGAVSIPAGRSLGPLGSSGQFEVQDIASQAVGVVAAPEAGSDWWDACAGAGGKALQLADAMGRDGKVFATDVRPEALANCKKRARTDGVRNVRLQEHDLAKDEPFTKEFDGVLVDAPCSGWGTWSRNPDARWRTDPRDPAQKRNLQLRMLNNAAQCVKSGGVLVYAVCTFTTEETTEVLEGFLKEHANFELDSFAHPLSGEPTDGAIQIWPWNGPGDAMFIARLHRKETA